MKAIILTNDRGGRCNVMIFGSTVQDIEEARKQVINPDVRVYECLVGDIASNDTMIDKLDRIYTAMQEDWKKQEQE